MKRYLQAMIIVVCSSFVLGLVFYASYANYMSIQENVIRIEQNQLLTLAETVSNSIESFFIDHQRDLEVISKNSLFIRDYEAYAEGRLTGDPWRLLDDYYQINKVQVESIGIVDQNAHVVYAVPMQSNTDELQADIRALIMDSSKTIGKIFKQNGELYVHVLNPVKAEGKTHFVLYMRIRLIDIYEELVAPVKAGDKGYASVKDAQGVLIMHPNTSDLGQEVLEARRSQYPDFDWSELEDLVAKQRMGQSGVGVYHSLWFKDDVRERVQKFSAYTPAMVGDTFWIVTISKDYLEVVSFLKERTYTIIIVNFALLILFVTLLLIYYRMIKDRKALKIQKTLSEEVLVLNVALEDDIEMRKTLEAELIESKEWYETIFNSSSDFMLITEMNPEGNLGHILEANVPFLSHLGYSKEFLQALSYSDVSQVYALGAAEGQNFILNLTDGKIYEDGFKTFDGSIVPVEVNVRIFEGPRGKQSVMVARDITMKKSQEAAVKRSEERFRAIVQQVADRVLDLEDLGHMDRDLSNDKEQFAIELENINMKLEKLFKDEVEENKRKEALMIYQARLAAMGEMIASIAHQWRQPLSVMQMLFINVMDAYQHGELDENLLKEQHERLLNLTKHMSETIDDFRYFFNPNAKENIFLISKTIQKSFLLLDDAMKQAGVEIHLDIQSDCLISGYDNQLSQVFLSIFQNSIEALKVCQDEERAIWVTIEQQNEWMQISVEDNAGGVDDALISRLYEAHFSTKKAQQGTGLGLYIAKVIIEKNFAGTIHSANGTKGLITTILIPYGGATYGTTTHGY